MASKAPKCHLALLQKTFANPWNRVEGREIDCSRLKNKWCIKKSKSNQNLNHKGKENVGSSWRQMHSSMGFCYVVVFNSEGVFTKGKSGHWPGHLEKTRLATKSQWLVTRGVSDTLRTWEKGWRRQRCGFMLTIYWKQCLTFQLTRTGWSVLRGLRRITNVWKVKIFLLILDQSLKYNHVFKHTHTQYVVLRWWLINSAFFSFQVPWNGNN